VEILFLDAPKRIKDIKSTFIEFGPWLIPNVSIIVLQDFAHFPSFEIAIFISFFQDSLELIHAVDGDSTVSFKVKDNNNFNHENLQDFEFKNFTTNELIQKWNNLLSILPINSKELLEPGISMLLHDLGEKEKALEQIKENKFKWRRHEKFGRLVDSTIYERYRILFDGLGIKRSKLFVVRSLFNANKRTVLLLNLEKMFSEKYKQIRKKYKRIRKEYKNNKEKFKLIYKPIRKKAKSFYKKLKKRILNLSKI